MTSASSGVIIFSFYMTEARNKAGYTAADASSSAFSLIPAARVYMCVSVCVCERVRAFACVCGYPSSLRLR